MPIYQPIRTSLNGTVRDIRLISTRWRDRAFSADFGNSVGQFLRVGFQNPIAIRMLDHVAVTRLEAGPQEGASARFFAYEVFGAQFYFDHLEGLEAENEQALHYRFIVLDNCLDVISLDPPSMRVLSQA